MNSNQLFCRLTWISTSLVALVLSQTSSALSLGSTQTLVQSQGSLGTAIPANEPYEPNPVEDLGDYSTTKPDVHGTFSVENFSGTQNPLYYTHDSADGFRNYLAQWYSPNYVYRDSGVGVWAFHDVLYGDNYDLWVNGSVDYGIDAVLTSFQSSHGVLNNTTKIYTTSMGSNWAGRGWNATSNNMALGGNANSFGNERLRYMFWDTCQSVKWNNGVNPMQTWGPRAKGIRMIFGYDTNSVDSPNYGKFFWEEWNKNKTFKYAFLDASWRINHGQSPCLVAFGSSQSDALYRRDTERNLYWGAISSSWGAWAWYGVGNGPDGGGAGSNLAAIPPFVVQRSLNRQANQDQDVIALANDLGIQGVDAGLIENRQFGLRAVHTQDLTLVVEADGDYELQFKNVQPRAVRIEEALSDEAAVSKARELVNRFGLLDGQTQRITEIRTLNVNSAEAGGEPGANLIEEKTIIFDQVVDGIAFIDADAGRLEVTMDAASGELKNIRHTIKSLSKVSGDAAPQATRGLAELRRLALEMVAEAPTPGLSQRQANFEIVPESEQIGYVLRDDQPLPVYRAHLRSLEHEGAKLFEATVPLASNM